MKKKIVFSLAAALCVLCCALCLVACGGGHEHDFGDEWKSNGLYHWRECQIEGCEEKEAEKGEHADADKDGRCDVCSYALGTPGLKFRNEGETMTVIGLAEGTNNTTIVIPLENDGLPVTAVDRLDGCEFIKEITVPDSVTTIMDSAFSDCEALRTLYLGKGVKTLGAPNGASSFIKIYYAGDIASYCGINGLQAWNSYKKQIYIGEEMLYGMAKIVIPEGVTSIGKAAFWGCEKLSSITIPASVTEIGENAFTDCYRLVEVCNKSSLTITAGADSNGKIALRALNVYSDGESKVSVIEDKFVVYDNNTLVGYLKGGFDLTVPAGITKINAYALRGLTITTVNLSTEITEIGSYALPVKTVNYAGTKEQWNNVTKAASWKAGISAVVVCSDGQI